MMSREREERRRILRMKTTKTMTNQLMKMTKSRLFMFSLFLLNKPFLKRRHNFDLRV